MQKTRFRFLGKSGPGKQKYMKIGGRFPANKCRNHYNYKLKWASRNSPGTAGTAGQSSAFGKIVQLQPTLPHALGVRITVVSTNSLKLYIILYIILHIISYIISYIILYIILYRILYNTISYIILYIILYKIIYNIIFIIRYLSKVPIVFYGTVAVFSVLPFQELMGHCHIDVYISDRTSILQFSTSSRNNIISVYLIMLFPTSSTSLFPTSSAYFLPRPPRREITPPRRPAGWQK